MRRIVIALIILAAVALGWLFFRRSSPAVPVPAPVSNNSDMVRVSSPQPQSLISSPVSVTGEARGNWYFEASFPVRIVDENGHELGRAPAQAQGDWMTTDFVPFVATVSFSTSTAASGYIVLEKDNPSGLPQNAGEVRVPVRFR